MKEDRNKQGEGTPECQQHQESYATDTGCHKGRRMRINAKELKIHLENNLESNDKEPQMPTEKYGLYTVGGREPLG